jgi:hypothetical protein
VRRAAVVLAGVLLLAAPAPASADVIFDPADADELASVLAEAYTDQGVCYGWHVSVDNVGIQEESVGSNFGAGKSAATGSCEATVEFWANITYTSESSESEDSASYDVRSTPSSVTRDDLDALGLDFGGLTGDDPGVVVGKAVTALPLLAADKGIATPLSAAPDTATAPADARLTDDPGSDWWRDRGGMLIWALVLLAASGLLVWWILRVNRRRRPAPVEAVPDYVPEPWEEQATAAPWDPEAGPPSTVDRVEDETSVTTPPAAKAATADPADEQADAESAGVEPAGVEPAGVEPAGVEQAGVESAGVESGGVDPAVTGPLGAESAGAESGGVDPAVTGPPGAESTGAESGGADLTGADPVDADQAGAESGGSAPADTEPSDAESSDAQSAEAEQAGAERTAAADPAGADPAAAKRSGDEPPPQKPTSSDESTKE